MEAKDIELVVEQTSCSRAKAVKALKANNGDIGTSTQASEMDIANVSQSTQSWRSLCNELAFSLNSNEIKALFIASPYLRFVTELCDKSVL